MMRQIFLAIALFTICQAADDVVKATKDNFDSIIGKDELTLVKFFAPWCGHCKKMAGDFKEAATELKGKAVLVDLDATEEKEIATKYGIRGFPTLKLFSKGEVIADYSGGRTKEALVKYIERALLPSMIELEDEDAVKKFAEENSGKAIVFGISLDKLQSEFKKMSMSLRDILPDHIVFGTVKDAKLLKSVTGDKEVSADQVVLVRDDETIEIYTGSAEDLEGWTKVGALPLYQEVSRDNASLYTGLGKPIFILFQEPNKKNEEVNAAIEKIAKKHRSSGELPFTWINISDLKSFAEHLGVGDKDPAIAIYDFATDAKFIFEDDYSEEALDAWVTKYIKGEMKPHMKSEPVPEKNDEPVYVVVGDSWKDVVEDSEKDVLIEQYAPWCGHCKALAPVLDELATDLKDVKTLTIAKMDATKNDAPKEYKAQGYPTLHFFAAGAKEGIPYNGGRSKEDFIKFIRENATHKEGIPTADEAKEDAKEDDKEEL